MKIADEENEMTIEIVREKIAKDKLERIVTEGLGDMIKVVVDIERGIATVGGVFHSDGEAMLLEDGSKQENLWGANLYPREKGEKRIEFSALINIRPRQNNRGMWIEDENIRSQIKAILDSLIPEEL